MSLRSSSLLFIALPTSVSFLLKSHCNFRSWVKYTQLPILLGKILAPTLVGCRGDIWFYNIFQNRKKLRKRSSAAGGGGGWSWDARIFSLDPPLLCGRITQRDLNATNIRLIPHLYSAAVSINLYPLLMAQDTTASASPFFCALQQKEQKYLKKYLLLHISCS